MLYLPDKKILQISLNFIVQRRASALFCIKRRSNVSENCSKLCSTCVNYLKQFRKTGTTFAHCVNCKGKAGFQGQRNIEGKRSPVFKEPALVNLPNEVILIISSLLPIRSLVNLSSVSKKLQHVINSGLAQNLWHDKSFSRVP